MASATATATMAAAGFDKRASSTTTSSSLHTPGSATFPSELRSPLPGSPGFLKREADLKTPITPPSAYLDFLRNMSPAMLSPAPTSAGGRFTFGDKVSDKTSQPSTDQSTSPPTSQPTLSRNISYESTTSTVSTASASTDRSGASTVSAASTARNRPPTPRVIIPPSAFARPGPRSARTPRRLQIPQSPAFSPALPSAHSVASFSSTPLSAAPWSASFSPRDVDPEINGKPGKVSVRQVVTRTVTYCRTPLEPAPKGKRRKLEETDPKPSLDEPPIKQEKLDNGTSAFSAAATAPTNTAS